MHIGCKDWYRDKTLPWDIFLVPIVIVPYKSLPWRLGF